MESNKELHIISFNVPYPANYGGVIDVFYKIKSLHKLGVKINLHCFIYNRPKSKELEKYCKTIKYYKRPKSIFSFISLKPFIVKTRTCKLLLKNLKEDNFPIIFEGLHTTSFLKKITKNNRIVIVRTHNIEHDYYNYLANDEESFLKKFYYRSEASKLKKYESILKSSIQIAAISEEDYDYFKKLNDHTHFIPAFHPFEKTGSLPGKGSYIFYHGNLSVNENIKTAIFIIEKIASKTKYQYKIAGKNPDNRIVALAQKYSNVELISNPDNETLFNLIKHAHINLMLTFQNTGVKLKLINTLYTGRHCIVNDIMIKGTNLESLCHIKNTEKEIIDQIKSLMKIYFVKENIDKREKILLKYVNNLENAQKVINLLSKK